MRVMDAFLESHAPTQRLIEGIESFPPNCTQARMQMRRFTGLTNAFSKRLQSLKAACALHFAHYNFCRVHSPLRVTPAMAAGLSSEIWPLSRLVLEG